MRIYGKCVAKGVAEGFALVSKTPLTFYGGVDPNTGFVIERGHELYNECLKDRVLILPTTKGSTVAPYIILRLKANGCAPTAMIFMKAEPTTAVGAILADIPTIHNLSLDIFSVVMNGMKVKVVSSRDKSYVEVIPNKILCPNCKEEILEKAEEGWFCKECEFHCRNMNVNMGEGSFR